MYKAQNLPEIQTHTQNSSTAVHFFGWYFFSWLWNKLKDWKLEIKFAPCS